MFMKLLQVQDLLELSSSRDSLVVRWSTDRGFYVEDLFCVTCENEDDLMAVLEEGIHVKIARGFSTKSTLNKWKIFRRVV